MGMGAWARKAGLWVAHAVWRSDWLLPTAVALPLILIFLGPALIGRGAYLPTDLSFSDSLWQAARPVSYAWPANGLTSDLYTQFYPMRYFAQQTMRTTGRLPFWNPFIFAGQPHLTDGQSGVLYPLNAIGYVLPASAAFAWGAALRIYLAVLFAFLLLRALGCGRAGALVAGIAFAFCGPFVVWQGYPHVDVFVWLPGALWCLERALAARRPLGWLVLMAVFVALAGLAGHYESYFHTLAVIALWAIYALWRAPAGKRLALGLLMASAITLGIAVTSVQTVPFAINLRTSGTMLAGGRSSVGPQDSWLYSPKTAPNLAAAAALLFPEAFGNPMTRDYYWPFTIFQNYTEQSIYIGTLPLLLALLAALHPKRRHRAFLLALAIAAFGVAYRLPLFEAVNHLPIFSVILNKRLRMIAALALAVLAGLGADDLVSASDAPGRLRRMSFVLGGAALGITAIAGGWYLYVAALRHGWVHNWPPAVVHSISAVWRLGRVRTWLPVPVAGVAAVAVVLYARRKLGRAVLIGCLLALTAGELVYLGRGYCPTLPATWLYPASPAIDYLRSQPQPTRVLGADQAFLYNAGMVLGIPEIGGYDLPAPRRIAALYRKMGGTDIHRQRWQPEWPVTEALGVQYIVCTRELPAGRFEMVYDGEVRIYRVRRALPRVISVSQVTGVQGEAEALEALLSPSFDPRQVALVEMDGQAVPTQLVPAQALDIARYDTDRVSLRSNSQGTSFVVLCDAYDPGWSATIDGVPTAVYPADYLWRGIVVPAGEHVVELSYEPVGYRLGLALSAGALAVLLSAAAFAGLQAHRDRRHAAGHGER